MGWQWHQLDHMQIICTSLQTDNHASTSPVFTGWMPFLPPNQQCQSTEGFVTILKTAKIYNIEAPGLFTMTVFSCIKTITLVSSQ